MNHYGAQLGFCFSFFTKCVFSLRRRHRQWQWPSYRLKRISHLSREKIQSLSKHGRALLLEPFSMSSSLKWLRRSVWKERPGWSRWKNLLKGFKINLHHRSPSCCSASSACSAWRRLGCTLRGCQPPPPPPVSSIEAHFKMFPFLCRSPAPRE